VHTLGTERIVYNVHNLYFDYNVRTVRILHTVRTVQTLQTLNTHRHILKNFVILSLVHDDLLIRNMSLLPMLLLDSCID
jgi:hypothetical protein